MREAAARTLWGWVLGFGVSTRADAPAHRVRWFARIAGDPSARAACSGRVMFEAGPLVPGHILADL